MRNNLLMLIGAQDPASLNTREGKELLGKAMLDDVTAVLVKMAGKGKVNEIFFTSFVMQ
jgi:flagellar FliL protein